MSNATCGSAARPILCALSMPIARCGSRSVVPISDACDDTPLSHDDCVVDDTDDDTDGDDDDDDDDDTGCSEDNVRDGALLVREEEEQAKGRLDAVKDAEEEGTAK